MRLLVICPGYISEDQAQNIVHDALELDSTTIHTWKVRRAPDKIHDLIRRFEPDILAMLNPTAQDIARACNIRFQIEPKPYITFIGFNTADEFTFELEQFEAEDACERAQPCLHFH